MAIIRKKQAKEQGKVHGLRFPDRAVAVLDTTVEGLIAKACERAKANGRKTIKGADF